jgi:Uma2 family endonuclease
MTAKKWAQEANGMTGVAVPFKAAPVPLPGTTIDPMYPDEDGRPMGDTDFHSIALIMLREALEDFFAAVRDVYIATNLIFYYQFGDPRARRDPDVLVAKGVVGKHRRRSFRIWEEKVTPCVLFEIASKYTWKVDLGEKRDLYARLKVPEYFIFDPEYRYIKPALQGFRSHKGVSVPLKPAKDGSLVSKQLGLRLVPEGAMLCLYDLRTGVPVLTRQERTERERERSRQARKRARQEKKRGDALAAEVQALRAELERFRKGKA